jgi:hypothetical protein
MNDTPPSVAKIVADRHRAMSPSERCLAAASLYETARAIIESSLPDNLTVEERRLAVARRFYGGELPEAALQAFARAAASR